MTSTGITDDGFADRSVLDVDRVPDRFPFRDAELDAIRTALSPTVNSGETTCVVLCGPSGQGKRTAVTVTAKRGGRSDGPEPRLVSVECDAESTAYRLAIATTNALSEEESLAESGYSRETAFKRLRGRIRDSDRPPVLRLDHAQRVDAMEFETLLAGILDATGTLPCAIVAVADGLEFRNGLDVETRARFDAELHFSPYDAHQRREIVEDRCAAAFHPDTCPDRVIEACLARADRADAPLPTAFDLLREAGDLAAARASTQLTTDDVEHAHAIVQRDKLVDAIERCSPHERRVLTAISTIEESQFADVYEGYRRQCRLEGVPPNRERSVHNYLDTLVDAGLVAATEARSSTGGRYFEYSLVPDADLVETLLGSVEEGMIDDDSPE